MLASSFHVSADQSIEFINGENVPTNEDIQCNNNPIENFREFTRIYTELAEDEKKDFLSEAGITEESFKSFKAFTELDWKFDGSHPLQNSHSSISIPDGYALVLGSDADAIYKNIGEPAVESLEAYVCNLSNLDNAVLFQNFQIGYVSTDDWKDIDPKALLSAIIENTEEGNKERLKNGNSEMHTLGWIQEPTLDKHSNTVYWAIELDRGENENIINAVALRLGREGYEEITWVTPISAYVPLGGELEVMLRAHRFDAGYRYDDYKAGDRIAEYGIAALVAASMGEKC